MTVSGTPLSPSFRTQEGKGEWSNICGGNPHHTPQRTGTLLSLRTMTASAPCSSSCDGHTPAAVTLTDFGWSAHAVIALTRKVPFLLFLITCDVTVCTAFTHSGARKCCRCRNYDYLSLCPCSRQNLAFPPAKVLHVSRMASVFIRNTSGIFLSELALKAYSRHLQYKPSECHATDLTFCGQRKNQIPDGRSKAPEQKGNRIS